MQRRIQLHLTLVMMVVAIANGFVPSTPQSQRSLSFFHLSSTKEASSTTASSTTTTPQQKNNVIFQKVVRSPPQLVSDTTMIVGPLISYLQDVWEVPERLPMPYHAATVEEDNGTVVRLTPSTSTTNTEQSLDIQVVALVEAPSLAMVVVVRTADTADTTKSNVPVMLQQFYRASETTIVAALERGLDQWSAGDVTVASSDATTTVPTEAQWKEQTEAVLRDFVGEDDDNEDQLSATNHGATDTAPTASTTLETSAQRETSRADGGIIVDAEIVPQQQQQPSPEQQRAAAWQTMQSKPDTTATSTKETSPKVQSSKMASPTLDYAVAAAKRALAKQKERRESSGGDYAVQQAAARAATGTLRKKKKKATPRPVKQQQDSKKSTMQAAPEPIDPSQQRLPLLTDHTNSAQRSFLTTISTPEQYSQWQTQQRQGEEKNASRNKPQQQKMADDMRTNSTCGGETATQDAPVPETTSSTTTTMPPTEPATREKSDATMRSGATTDAPREQQPTAVDVSAETSDMHDNIIPASMTTMPPTEPATVTRTVGATRDGPDTTIASGAGASPNSSIPSSAAQRNLHLRTTPAKLPEEENDQAPVLDPAGQTQLEAMDEMEGHDMTPEELLADVMQFGEQQREAPGEGFVHEALTTAKELLQAQRAKREAASQQQQSVTAPAANPTTTTTTTTLTPDEELRRMFAAGEQLADGRITTTQQQQQNAQTASSMTSPEDNKLIDSVIAAEDDKTISSHARVLDDELVELELRINKSVGEEHDGPIMENPFFDIMSGPEVYNRNVDPETAVNWPGAMPGTKQVRHLPKELEEATKQANFAVHVLLHMQKTELANGEMEYTFGNKQLTKEQICTFKRVVEDAVELGIVDDPVQLQAEESRLQLLLDELWDQPEERTRNIAENYKDLLLSDYFVHHVKKRLSQMAQRDLHAAKDEKEALQEKHKRERVLLGQLVSYTQLLLKETQALGADLEAQQLEVIRSICKVAMNPNHKTEEETAMALTDAVRDMRPLFDDAFVAYLKYAVAEEEGRLARAGVLDDPEESRWLMVLQIVQKGVYAEIAKGINRYLEHIWYILRMETPQERRMFLEMLVDDMPTLDVRPFVRVIENIAGALGDSVRGEFDGAVPLGEMTNKLLQLYRDTKEVLPPERIAEKSRDADEWAAKQKQRLLDQRKLTKQRLKGAAKTEHLDEKIDEMERRGEFDRFD